MRWHTKYQKRFSSYIYKIFAIYTNVVIINTLQNESVNTKTVEISNLRDRITSLEAMLSSITEEKVQNEVSPIILIIFVLK